MQHATGTRRAPLEDVLQQTKSKHALGRASKDWRTPRADGEAPIRAYQGSRFADVWRAVAADPYDSLPDKRLRLSSVRTMIAKNIYRAAQRTLETREDLLPDFEKLVHPSGVCLRGTWTIDETTPYTGLFKTGARGLIIARAGDSMGEQREGKLRFMGLAGKLYATTDPDHPTPLPTANFFLLENFSGSYTKHFVDARLSTDLLPLVPHLSIVSKAPLGAIAGPAFALADRALLPIQPMIRQLYPISELDGTDREDAVTPVVMRMAALPNSRRVETPDMREELDMRHHPEGLRFDLEVSDHRSFFFPTGFRRIGQIHFTESVSSYSGDHRLHFAHPPYRHFAR